MTEPRRLPRTVEKLLRVFVPRAAAPLVLADLGEDYSAARLNRRRLAAWWWLGKETASLAFAYGMSRTPRWRTLPALTTRDAHLVLRGMRRRPFAALGAAGMLAIGLLALMITAGLAQTLLFRPLSATHGEALLRIAAIDHQGRLSFRLSYPELEQLRAHVVPAATIASVNLQPALLRADRTTLQTLIETVDGDYFAVMGLRTVAGRGLLRADDRAAAPPVVVIAEPFWRAHFDGAKDVIGRTLLVNGAAYTVVGVLAGVASSSFLGASVDAWIPLAHADSLLNRGWRTDPTSRWFNAFALPHGGVPELEARLGTATTELRRLLPEEWRERRLETATGSVLVGPQRADVMLLVSILGILALLILSVAAANVGGVLLARAASDDRQNAIHLAIGSGRAAVFRRFLLEGAALGLVGATVAAALYAGARSALAEISLLPTLALRLELPFGGSMLAVLAIAGAAAGMLLALGPAVWALRVDVGQALREGDGRMSGGRAIARTRRALIATQVCLSMSLIVGASLFAQSVRALGAVDLGFSAERVVAVDFDLEPASAPEDELPRLAREAIARLVALPTVTGVAMSNRAPVDQSTPLVQVRSSADGVTVEATMYLATETYFATIGLPITSGRGFLESDLMGANVAMVNRALAARLWPDEDAIGRSILVGSDGQMLRVVGVAANSKYRSLSEAPRAHIYRPTPPTLGLTLLARITGDPYAALGAIQRALDDVGPGLVGFFPRTMADHLAIDLLPTRAAAGAATILAALALTMSGVGLYGLVSWFVALRRREIGIRMAMGASARSVRVLVLRQALGAATPGLVAGIAVAAALASAARSALYGVGPLNLMAFGLGIAALAVVVIVASYLPGRRATRVDPAVALRH